MDSQSINALKEQFLSSVVDGSNYDLCTTGLLFYQDQVIPLAIPGVNPVNNPTGARFLEGLIEHFCTHPEPLITAVIHCQEFGIVTGNLLNDETYYSMSRKHIAKALGEGVLVEYVAINVQLRDSCSFEIRPVLRDSLGRVAMFGEPVDVPAESPLMRHKKKSYFSGSAEPLNSQYLGVANDFKILAQPVGEFFLPLTSN